MVQGGLLTAHPGGGHGDGGVPGGGSSLRQGARAASPGSPDLETAAAEIQRGVAKVRSILGVSTPRAKYMRRGAPGGPTSQSGGSLARPRVGPRHLPSWLAGVALLRSFGDSGSFRCADFLSDFSGFFGALLMAGKPERKKRQKT